MADSDSKLVVTVTALSGNVVLEDAELPMDATVLALKKEAQAGLDDSWPLELMRLMWNDDPLEPDEAELQSLLGDQRDDLRFLLMKLHPSKVHFKAANNYGLSAKKCEGEGFQLTNALDQDLWIKMPHSTDVGVYSFESVTHPSLFLSAKLAVDGSTPHQKKVTLEKPDGESEFFRAVAPLDIAASDGFVTLESIAAPRHVVNHCGGWLWCHDPENPMQSNPRVFVADSTWTMIME